MKCWKVRKKKERAKNEKKRKYQVIETSLKKFCSSFPFFSKFEKKKIKIKKEVNPYFKKMVLRFKILTTASSVLNMSLVSSLKRLQIDKLPDPPFPISFSILKSNPRFNNKNAGKLPKSILLFILNTKKETKRKKNNQSQCLIVYFDRVCWLIFDSHS